MTQNTMTPTDLIESIDIDGDDGLAIPACETDILLLDNTISETPVLPSPPPQDGANCIAVMGAAGGVGVTSLCIQMAHDLAIESQKKLQKTSRSKEARICLIDLDFEGGSSAHHLDLTPSLSMSDLIQSPENIDRALISALVTTHASGMDLLAAPNTLGGNDMANPLVVVALLDLACQMYDHVIIDVPRYWRPWNMAAIGGADKFAIVTDLTIPSLHLARMRMNAIEEKLDGTIRAEIILNKYERRSFRNALRQKDAEIALKRGVSATICVDTETLREAINCGEPSGVIRPDSRYVKDVRYVQKIMQKQHDTAERSAA
ncbi:MAG: AAA family ATPase [Hellea sp.]